MDAALQTLVAAVVVFTALVLVLAIGVRGAARLLAPSGQATVRINGERELVAPLGTRLLAALASRDILLPAACGGRGACGQCRVRVRGDGAGATAVEASHLTREALREGWRLACMVTLRDDLQVEVPAPLLEVRRYRCTVVSTRHITTLMKEIVLAMPAGEALDFHAGSYVQVDAPPHRVRFADFDIGAAYRERWRSLGLLALVSDSDAPASRAYSLAGPPAEPTRLVLTVRIALPPPGAPPDTPPGRVSSWLFSLRAGDAVDIAGPYGDFRATEGEGEMVLIGGGAGIAPLRSIILDQLGRPGSRRRIGFWYGARNRRELCYADEFDALAREHARFHWHAALSEPLPDSPWQGHTGFIHRVVHDAYLARHPAPWDLDYFICGPPVMNVAVIQMLEDLGVERRSIHLDDFGAPT